MEKSKIVRLTALFVVLAAASMLSFQEPTEGDIVMLKAEKVANEQAEGTEVWVEKVFVDGQYFSAESLCDGNWIFDQGKAGWREYGQPKGLEESIQLTIPYGEKRWIEFESNKWRGYVTIVYNGNEEQLDLYSTNEFGTVSYNLPEHCMDDNNQIDRTVAWIVVGAGLIGILLSLGRKNWKTERIPFQNVVWKEREVWADLLRIMCTYIIMLLHATNAGFDQTYGSSTWIWYLIVNCFTACAVPIFFMLSGALTIQKEELYINKVDKRLMKVVFPLVIWSIVYIFVRKIILKEDLNVLIQIIRIPMEPQYYHLWFIYTVCGLYILNPVISYLYYCQNRKLKIYIMSVFGLVPMVLTTLSQVTGYKVEIAFIDMLFPVAVIYIAGKVMIDHKTKICEKKYLWVVLFLIGFCMVSVFTYFGSVYAGEPVKKFFTGADNFPMILTYMSVFCIMISFEKKLQKMSDRLKWFIANWSNNCVQIYFMHMFIYILIGERSVGRWFQLSYHSSDFIQNFVTSIVCFGVSSVAAWLLQYMTVREDHV